LYSVSPAAYACGSSDCHCCINCRKIINSCSSCVKGQTGSCCREEIRHAMCCTQGQWWPTASLKPLRETGDSVALIYEFDLIRYGTWVMMLRWKIRGHSRSSVAEEAPCKMNTHYRGDQLRVTNCQALQTIISPFLIHMLVNLPNPYNSASWFQPRDRKKLSLSGRCLRDNLETILVLRPGKIPRRDFLSVVVISLEELLYAAGCSVTQALGGQLGDIRNETSD
jgi:hypothetical protein